MRVLVLGAGRVGRAIVQDLASDGEFAVTAADASSDALAAAAAVGAARTVEADFTSESDLERLAADHDLVVGAVPGPLGFRVLEALIPAGKDVVDISFFEQDPFRLDDLAKQHGVTVVVDCGVAPGLSNLLLGFFEGSSERVSRFACYVGGLPVDRSGLFQYKASFSPIDVMAEYTRPGRYVEGGEIMTEPALSLVEQLEFGEVGTLEAFLTDGLRTLIRTSEVPNMCEKTMRYPGHADQMRLLREMGLFGEEPVDVRGVSVRPCDLTARLLFPLWQFEPGERDLTVMRVEIDAVNNGTETRHVFDLLDYCDETTDTQSMARTTGYTCTAMTRVLAHGGFERKGICPPEFVGRDPTCFEQVVSDLKERGVGLTESVSRDE